MWTAALLVLPQLTLSGWPISQPDSKNENNGGKSAPYNMVDAFPICYARGLCPMFEPGGELSAFPNSEEKFQHILHNLFRNFGNFTLDLKYAKWTYGANTQGGLTGYCKKGCTYCGSTHPDRVPLYWYSDANQLARFKQYDENVCDQDWYDEPGISAHHTCDWILEEYQELLGTSNCDLFGDDCGFGARASAYCEEDRCWFETEGICGGSTCVTDAHCDPIFANKYDYQGTGFVEGMNGAATVYSRYTKEIWYVLPSGSHFDERMKVIEEDYHPDGHHFTLMLQYFDANHTQMPSMCWSLYDGQYHEMDVLVSEVGSVEDGFSKDSYSVMFTTNHPPPSQCEPYSFMCKTTENNVFRLPEESEYYFGTEWIDWKWSDYASYGEGYTCKENHYYNDGWAGWTVNGDPQLDRCDIWFYKNFEVDCQGCSKIAKLDCWQDCILSDFAPASCACESVISDYTQPDACIGWMDPPSPLPTLEPTPPPTKDVCCECLAVTAPAGSIYRIAGCMEDPRCELFVCDTRPECCTDGWSAWCVLEAANKCYAVPSAEPTTAPSGGPISVTQNPAPQPPVPSGKGVTPATTTTTTTTVQQPVGKGGPPDGAREGGPSGKGASEALSGGLNAGPKVGPY